MRFKKENWQPTIGDKYDIVNFNGLIFVWPKERVTAYEEPYKICGVEPIYEEVHQIVGSDLQLNQRPVITNAYVGIQVSSKYMREHHHEFIAENSRR